MNKTPMRKPLVLAATAAAAMLTGPVFAQTAPAPGFAAPTMGATAAPVPAGSGIDMTIGTLQGLGVRDFFREAASGDMFEVDSSRMTLDKASREDIRAFARQMIDDHTLTTRQLADVGAPLGFGLPMRAGIDNVEKLERLQTLSGASFDQQYAMDRVMAHRDAIRLYQTAIVSGSADMAPFLNFAMQTLPKLRMHLQHAEALARMGTPTANQ